jgi:hypothetical protein
MSHEQAVKARATRETYLGNPNVKRDGVAEQWTQESILEYKKCMDNPIYFSQKYIKVISLDEGLVPFDLYPYQQEMFGRFNEHRFNIILACRQSGKSISVCAYLLWYALFHPEKTVAILANKASTAREMLSRITLMLENLPFFLQAGTKALNKGSLEFGNNSRIITAATTGSSIRGLSINLLYLDEFAFVEKAAEFYTSTYPVVSAGKDTKVIITSTANGIGNMFYKIWEGAVQSVNEFTPFRVDWWDVPGRDEEWKQQTINNTSKLQFDQEFGNTFFGTGDTLISAEALMELRAKQPKRHIEQGDGSVYSDPEKGKEYIMCVDVGKGRGQDYSTFTLIDISVKPFEQVAVYRNNTISPLLFPTIIYKYAKLYNNAYVIVESNDQGSLVANGLYQELEYDNVHMESAVKANAIGQAMTRRVKRLGCSGLKDLIETNKLKIYDEQTILEISTFVAKGNSYEASEGNNDDLIMNLVMFGYFAQTQFFNDMTDINLKEMLFKQRMAEIEADIVPFGWVDDGSEWIKSIEEEEIVRAGNEPESPDWLIDMEQQNDRW